jgi:3-hydroxybutyryl-CoA dehydrogenase
VGIQNLYVLGAGFIGKCGYNVTIRDIEKRFVDNGMNTIAKNLSRDVSKGRKTKEEVDAILYSKYHIF